MTGHSPYEHDLEENDRVQIGSSTEDGAVAGETLVQRDTLYADVQRLTARFRVEQRGVERVLDEERHDASLVNVGKTVGRAFQTADTRLTSAIMALDEHSCVVFGHWSSPQSLLFFGITDACLVCLYFIMFAIIHVYYFSTFGPGHGLRQLVLSGYWFDWYGGETNALFCWLAKHHF